MSSNIKDQGELRSDRESVASHTVGFLKAAQQAAIPLHSLVGSSPSQEVMSCALAHLQIFTVRALETFFRDCFVLLCKRDESFLEKAIKATHVKLDYGNMYGFINGKASFQEHLAAQRNFQNLDVVNLAFEPLFGCSTFDALNNIDFSVLLPGDPPSNLKISLKERPWKTQLYELVEDRHRLIHNAHRPLPIDQKRVQDQAETAILLGQLFATHLAHILNVGIIATEAPMWMVIYTAPAMHTKLTPDELLTRVTKELASNPEFSATQGHIGPAIIFSEQLMRLRFTDSNCAHNTAAKEGVFHLLNKVGDGFELSTLKSIDDSEIDSGLQSVA